MNGADTEKNSKAVDHQNGSDKDHDKTVLCGYDMFRGDTGREMCMVSWIK